MNKALKYATQDFMALCMGEFCLEKMQYAMKSWAKTKVRKMMNLWNLHSGTFWYSNIFGGNLSQKSFIFHLPFLPNAKIICRFREWIISNYSTSSSQIRANEKMQKMFLHSIFSPKLDVNAKIENLQWKTWNCKIFIRVKKLQLSMNLVHFYDKLIPLKFYNRICRNSSWTRLKVNSVLDREPKNYSIKLFKPLKFCRTSPILSCLHRKLQYA